MQAFSAERLKVQSDLNDPLQGVRQPGLYVIAPPQNPNPQTLIVITLCRAFGDQGGCGEEDEAAQRAAGQLVPGASVTPAAARTSSIDGWILEDPQ